AREPGGSDPRAARPARQRGGQFPQHARRGTPGVRSRRAPVGTMKNLSLHNQLARPFTLLPPLLGIVSGAVCAFGSVHNPDPSRQLTPPVVLTVILGSVCASLMNAASNAINQIYDLEIDRLNKPNRPLVTGALSIREAWVFSWMFYARPLIATWLRL